MTTTQDTKNTGLHNISTETTKKSYRLAARNIALTYPQCTLTKEEVYTLLNERFHPINIIVSEEKHQDGTPHIHAYMQLRNKSNYKDPRWADLKGFHGNYKACTDKIGWQTYIMKDGNFKMNTDLVAIHWRGFRNEKADWDAWLKHNKDKKKESPFPFKLPDGELINKPELKEKQCNFLIIGEPNMGKTPWAQETFENKRIYCRTNDTQYPFDDYNGEEIILYDDVYPKLQEILQATNVYLIDTPVFGPTRYTRRYWPLKQRRILIILCNKERIPKYHEDPAFEARFKKIIMQEPYVASGGG